MIKDDNNGPVVGYASEVKKTLHEKSAQSQSVLQQLDSLLKLVKQKNKEIEKLKQYLPIFVIHKNRGPALITEDCLQMGDTGDSTSMYIYLLSEAEILEVSKDMVVLGLPLLNYLRK